jgi:hypothetical protein
MLPPEFDETGQAALAVVNGRQTLVDVACETMVTWVTRRGRNDAAIAKLVLDPALVKQDNMLAAPLHKGQVVGHIAIDCTPGPATEYLAAPSGLNLKVPVLCLQDVGKQGWMHNLAQNLRLFFQRIGDLLARPWREFIKSIT